MKHRRLSSLRADTTAVRRSKLLISGNQCSGLITISNSGLSFMPEIAISLALLLTLVFHLGIGINSI